MNEVLSQNSESSGRNFQFNGEEIQDFAIVASRPDGRSLWIRFELECPSETVEIAKASEIALGRCACMVHMLVWYGV
jgi:hypothetical protein